MSKHKAQHKIPGKNSRRLMKQAKQHISAGMNSTVPIFVAKSKGAKIWDVDGNEYIDFSSGISATNLGHGNPKLVKAVQKQAEKFFHTCYTIVPYESYVQVCQQLNKIIPISGTAKSALFNSGAEAVENAIKIARKYTGKQGVVSFDYGFHGRTLLTMSLTGKVKPYKDGFGPFAPETYKLEYPYVYRRPTECETEKEYVKHLLEQIESRFFTSVVEPENIACVVMELVAGEGGFIVSPKEYVQKLAKLCKKNGILFIVDEVQTGFGRTGKKFASEHYKIKPDLVATAKSLSNGLPLSGITGKAKYMDSVQPFGLGGTFSGNPLACASALESISYMRKHKTWKKAQNIGKITMQQFNELKEKSKYVGDVRGLGGMCAIEFVKDLQTKEPYKKFTERVARKCYERGLIINSAGILGNDIRALMPLIIKQKELMLGLDILGQAVLGN